MKKKMLLLLSAVAFCFADDITSDGNTSSPLAIDSSGYYVLNTYEDLAAFATLLKDNDSANARLASDIALTAGTAGSSDLPIVSFSGHLDGAGHMVDIGDILFGTIQKGARVENIGVRAFVSFKWGYTGILARYNYGWIKNCHTEGSIEGTTYVGGMVGSNEGVIDSSYNEARVSGSLDVGGIAGEDRSGASISHSYNKGIVRYVDRDEPNDRKNFGGIAGTCSGDSLIGNYNLADLGQDSAVNYVGQGGILGRGDNSIVDSCYNLGNIGTDSTGTSIGGILGYVKYFTQISHSYNKGAISGLLSVGGISGSNGSIYTSYNEGPVYGDALAGGISGSGALIVASYNTAPVAGKDEVGGLSGSGGDISFSYNLGSVTGETFVGGIAGDYRKSYLIHAYNIGAVKGDSIVGGLVGERAYDSHIRNAYNFGSVTASKSGNCILDYEFQISYTTLSSVYYNQDSCSLGNYWDGNKGQNQATESFKDESITALLNADSAYWEQGEIYPVLYPYDKILEIQSELRAASIPDIVPAVTFSIRTKGLDLYIDGATEGTPVAIFDIRGNLEIRANTGRNGFEYQVKRPGVYVLRIGQGLVNHRLLLLK